MRPSLTRPALYWAVWHSCAVVALLALIGFRFGVPPWRFNQELGTIGLILGAGYLLGALVVHRVARRSGSVSLIDVVVSGLAGFSPVFLYVLVADLHFSRMVLLMVFVAGVTALGGVLVWNRWARLRAPALIVLIAGMAGLLVLTATSGGALAPPASRAHLTTQIATSLYTVQARVSRNYLPRTASPHTGGGIALLPDSSRYLVVTSDGHLYEVGWPSPDSAPRVERLNARVPLNRNEFLAVTGPGGFVNYFRAFDLLVLDGSDRSQILVSHHAWKDDERCFVVQVSALEWDPRRPLQDLTDAGWTTLHQTEPCLALTESEPDWPFRGMEGGGRMAALDEQHVLLTVGDQGFNGVDFAIDHVQDPNASYGKTVVVDLADGSWEPYTIGHRNPQGLWVDSAGGVWLTEHGPQGGDELNRLSRGGHYGWPLVTYGTDYGRESWPLNVRQGRHEGFVKPVYSWLPSIGASNLIVVQGALFEGWRGDLLIGSLVSEALWRVRVEDERVALVERIDLGERVRDIVEDPSGRILLLTDSYSILQLSPTTHVYAVCSSCHGPIDGSAPRLGPPLNGVVGRPIAGVAEFPYSEALRAIEGTWTDERLHSFLQDPQGFAPGTTMRMHGIGDEPTRARIIEYLSNRDE